MGIIPLGSLLAQQVPAPGASELYSLLGAAGWAIGIIVLCLAGLSYLKNIRQPQTRHISPQPVQVKNVGDLATISQLDQVEQQFDKRFDKMENRFDEVFKAIGNEGRRVDTRINTLSERLSEFIGRFDQSQKRRPQNHD